MAVKIPCTFLVRGDQYELIAIAGSNILDLRQFPTPPDELQMARHATYEIILDALYLVSLTMKEEKVRYLPVGGVDRTGDPLPHVYGGLSMVVPFSGKIRLARGFIDEPYINMSYQRALAFEMVLDIALKDGQVTAIKNRSYEMQQKRQVLKEYHESLTRLRNAGMQQMIWPETAAPRTSRYDGKVTPIRENREGMDQTRCVLKEYYESTDRLEKVLFTYGLDIDLE